MASNKQALINKFGSEEAYREWLRTNGAKGGQAPHKARWFSDPENAAAAGRRKHNGK